MAKGSKLKNALDRYKGVDKQAEVRRKQQKESEKISHKKKEKRKQELKQVEEEIEEEVSAGEEETGGVGMHGVEQEGDEDPVEAGWETNDEEDDSEDDDAEEDGAIKRIDITARLEDSDTDSSDDEAQPNGADSEEDDASDDEDIPLSDIASLPDSETADVVPHQRLTINNTTALLKAHKSLSLPYPSLSFSDHMTITSSTPIQIADVNDDLARELAFYKQSLDAVTEARSLLKKEGAPFTRPADYFAEMVKSDEHMGKVKQKLVDEAAGKRAAAEARKQRDLKRFGKQVQVAKLQERDRQKRETLDKINVLKRKRQGADLGQEDDMFDVALEDAETTAKNDRAARKASASGKPNTKRQKRDEKYGFGGKKRFSKSNDAKSSADTRGFSVKKMKGKPAGSGGGKGKQRPGKARRAKRV